MQGSFKFEQETAHGELEQWGGSSPAGSDREAAEAIGSGRRWICEALDLSARGRKGWGGGYELEAEKGGVIGRVCA